MGRRGWTLFGGVVAAIVVLAALAGMAWWVVDDGADGGDDRTSGVCAAPTETDLDATVAASADWLARSQDPEGAYWYEYDRAADVFSDDYNSIRHAGVTMSLLQTAAYGEPGAAAVALETGDGGLDYMLDRLVVVDEDTADDRTAYVDTFDREAVLGSTALAVVGLVHRRIATADETHDDLLRSMGRFMQSLMRADGAMWAGATRNELEPIVGVTSTFYTGEAFWAFGLLANQFPDEGWDDSAEAVGHYLATARDAEEEIDNPPLADQWAAYGFAEMREWGDLPPEEVAYVRSLIDAYHGRVGREIGREENRVGDGTEPPDESVEQSRGAAFGTSIEATSSLWRLSAVDPGLADLEDQLRIDTVCGAAILAARQYDAEQALEWPQPDVVEGAWFTEDVTRMDDQQHAMSGVLLANEALG